MPRKQEEIKFEVVAHFTGEKQVKELLQNLIMREISENNTKISKKRNKTAK